MPSVRICTVWSRARPTARASPCTLCPAVSTVCWSTAALAFMSRQTALACSANVPARRRPEPAPAGAVVGRRGRARSPSSTRPPTRARPATGRYGSTHPMLETVPFPHAGGPLPTYGAAVSRTPRDRSRTRQPTLAPCTTSSTSSPSTPPPSRSSTRSPAPGCRRGGRDVRSRAATRRGRRAHGRRARGRGRVRAAAHRHPRPARAGPR